MPIAGFTFAGPPARVSGEGSLGRRLHAFARAIARENPDRNPRPLEPGGIRALLGAAWGGTPPE